MRTAKANPLKPTTADLRACAEAYMQADAALQAATEPYKAAEETFRDARAALREALKTVPGHQVVMNGELYRLATNGTLSVTKIEVLP